MNETKKYGILLIEDLLSASGDCKELQILFDFLAEREGFEPSVPL
tara:strand:- start:1300 stop:1434 length:135 start_codon:yes stop_codon:yes gene_type:complete